MDALHNNAQSYSAKDIYVCNGEKTSIRDLYCWNLGSNIKFMLVRMFEPF